MKNIGIFLWWMIFTLVAIAFQSCFPGVDALLVGAIILLQERDYKNALWVIPFFILLQEGLGTCVFGTSIILYATTFVIFRLGRWLFEVENFVFIFLLSACIGFAYFCIFWLMAPLHDTSFESQKVIDICLIQALYIPFAWKILVLLRPRAINVEEK